ncbi:hypothetical protein BX661DRAFT_182505 [Kickxella alabastrina]|uniref:uncharacterized protein n=1 Tax=Kickxella alabastrina TaxID=61397 RepID=UPI0022200809|nr:uncharacterized protein BX661DRAFT_182505 [Kickxella alabastrina]KAI7827793.1 hypothetical protein BX661DRAFT_182505 [Kickxella alabastrina]
MVRTMAPELKNYMDKKLHLQLNGNRTVIGVLRGYDAFMNVHLADAFEVLSKKTTRHWALPSSGETASCPWKP